MWYGEPGNKLPKQYNVFVVWAIIKVWNVQTLTSYYYQYVVTPDTTTQLSNSGIMYGNITELGVAEDPPPPQMKWHCLTVHQTNVVLFYIILFYNMIIWVNTHKMNVMYFTIVFLSFLTPSSPKLYWSHQLILKATDAVQAIGCSLKNAY